MPPPVRRPTLATSACPRCGSASASPFSATGVCLRCAGVRVLALESTASPPEGVAASNGSADLPDRIGAYEIIEELGRGGMGRVLAARQGNLARIVALKVLPAGRGQTADLELRFLREAQTVAGLRHPNVIAIHDSGRVDGYVYFSMDYIEGGDLARRARAQPLTPTAAATLLQKVASALAYTHAAGVLHRDLKPSNILLDGDEPRVADFGLAAQLEAGGDLTAQSGVLGTPHYLAPEALRGGSTALSVASDIYALGVVMFELLTGRTPFAGTSPAELAALVERTEPPAPRLLAPAVPRDLETICLKCLERDPARRYADAGALAADLGRFLKGEPIVARPVSAGGRFLRWCRRRPALAAAWLLVCALALASTLTALALARERARTAKALAAAQQSDAASRDRLRAARIAEAGAVRHLNTPGHRAAALAALAEAAQIRPGPDVRDEVAAALLLPDVRALGRWELALDLPAQLTFSPQSDVVAINLRNVTGMDHGQTALRRWGEAKPYAQLETPGTRTVGPLRFSRDGTQLIARYLDETVRLWRVADAKPLAVLGSRKLPGPQALSEPYNNDYDFAPDGATFALGLADGGFSLHRSADAAELARWPNDTLVSTLRISPDGHRAAVTDITHHTGPWRVFLVALPECQLEHALTLPGEPNSLAWSSDGQLLAVALGDNTAVVYDPRTGNVNRRMPLLTRDIFQVEFAAHDTLLAQRGHGTGWHFANFLLGREEFGLAAVGPGMVNIPGGGEKFATATIESVATRWEIERPVGFRIIPTPGARDYDFGADNCGMDFSRNGRWVASGHGRYTLVREVETGRPAAELDTGESKPRNISGVAFDATDHALFRCTPVDGLQRLAFAENPDGTLAFSATEAIDPEPGFTLGDRTRDRSRLLLLDLFTGRVKIFEVGGGGAKLLARWSAPGVYSGNFSPDGQRVILNFGAIPPGAPAQHIRLYNAADGTALSELDAPISCDVLWSADGSTAMTSNGQTKSIVWDAATWRRRVELEGELGGDVTTFNLSPDGAIAIVQHDRRLHLVDARNGTNLLTLDLPGTSEATSCVKFLPDGRRIGVLWRDGRIDIVDPAALRTALAPLGLAW